MDKDQMQLLTDAIEFAIQEEAADLDSILADFQPPRSIRWAMASAAAEVLASYERGIKVGQEQANG